MEKQTTDKIFPYKAPESVTGTGKTNVKNDIK